MAVVGSLTAAGSSQASVVTVGPKLPIPVSESFLILCESGCLFTDSSVPAGASDVSPVEGVILRWRLSGGSVPYPGFPTPVYRLRVLSPFGDHYLAAGSSAPATPTHWGLETYPTRLPIKAGQLIALEMNPAAELPFGFSSTVTSVFLNAPLADGETGAPNTNWPVGFIFPFDADVLPPPVIDGLNPGGGSFNEPSTVTITGDNFAEVQSVTLGASPVDFTVDSESELTVALPRSRKPGTEPLAINTAAGSTASSYSYEACAVPRLMAKSFNAAKKALARHQCQLGRVRKRRYVTEASGRVVRQNPKAGTVLPVGGRVEVAIGRTRPQ